MHPFLLPDDGMMVDWEEGCDMESLDDEMKKLQRYNEVRLQRLESTEDCRTSCLS